MMRLTRSLSLLLFVFTCSPAWAEVDFIHDVRPIFEKHCYSCHGPEKQKSGFRLDIRSEAFKGGELYGQTIDTANADASLLIQFVENPDADLQMPPDSRLDASEIAVLKNWVAEGAVWPDGIDLSVVVDKTDHWSFKPREAQSPPKLTDDSWSRNAIDQFVLEKLRDKGFSPSPVASPIVWMRRVYFDLIGLPPTPEEIAKFVAELEQGDVESAYSRVVDELLASPRYGERWAQHWLDVVRYADTHGFEVNTERPNAWPYRDYVIQAMNNDTPYDQFIREQIIGDQLGQEAATGFLITASVLLPGQVGADDASKRLARQDAIDEIVTNISQSFLGLSVGCARCHDHKFDPISQYDYYAMQSFVAGVEYEDREVGSPVKLYSEEEQKKFREDLQQVERELTNLFPLPLKSEIRPAINPAFNTERIPSVVTKKIRFEIKSTNLYEPCIDELEVINASGENVALTTAGATVTASGSNVSPGRHQLEYLNDGRHGNSSSWMSNEVGKGWVIVEFPAPQEIVRINWGRDRHQQFGDRLAIEYLVEAAKEDGSWLVIADQTTRKQPAAERLTIAEAFGFQGDALSKADELIESQRTLHSQISGVEAKLVAFAGNFRTPDQIHLLTRGDPEQPKELIIPTILSSFSSVTLPVDAGDVDRRKALAAWISSPENPLTARVMANRIWQGHFGVGLVETPSDFGRTGIPPTHPELLDYLAEEFIRANWSIKAMHRLIVLSSTYRQSSANKEEYAKLDVDSRYLWRYPPRRLNAESIHDAILACSGRLNLRMGGPGFDLFNLRGGLTGFIPVESFTPDGRRRLIYAHMVRRERDAVFGAFDRPDGGQSAARRSESTTPIQALNLFNSKFVLEESAALAERLTKDSPESQQKQIERLWQITLNRAPTQEELDDAMRVADEFGVALLCRAIFNSNEFLFIP
ncbi:PSD1 and planctomycete cytochrome C domain-containing protein [Planctomicrobium sp. SH668]|uniref:PSD1 and planctomycete cytochrome C domain-containing protein n=1 Tax=Planctomicrobium sp. SH668 TaxID=3448126 RepID=UPI003F5B8FD6